MANPNVPPTTASSKASSSNGSKQRHQRDNEPVEVAYTYDDENGKPLRQVRCFDRGDGTTEFCQFRHTDRGWKCGVDGVRDVPYRLPRLLKAVTDDDRIFLVQGEECVDELTAEGVVATTNPEGAKEWPEHFQEFFQGARVVLLPDNDEQGREYMSRVAENLTPVVSTLRVIELPGLSEGESVSAWLDRGGNQQQLLRLANRTTPTVASPETKASLKGSGSSTWDTPQPLDPRIGLPAFPLEALPPFLSDYVAAVAKSTQTPVDLPAILSLAATAAVTFNIRIRIRPGFEVPLNLYVVLAVAVGEGKSPVYRELMRSLDLIEDRLQADVAPKISEARARREVAEANLAAIQKQIKDPKASPEFRASLVPDLEEARNAVESIHVPYLPRLYAQDATPEGLLKLLQEQGGHMAVLDDEGGELFELMRRYASSGRANQGIYLRGHDGGRLMADWSTKDAMDLDAVLLTLGLTVQPAVIHDLSGDPALRGRGLLARFLYSLPGSNVGNRDYWTAPISKELRKPFTQALNLLAERNVVPTGEAESRIRLGDRASERFREWSRGHEARLRPDGDLAGIADWGNKFPSQIARIGGILHAVDHPQDPAESAVSLQTIERAITLADYFVEHAVAAFNLMGSDPVIVKAIRIADWLRGKSEVTQREIQRARQNLFDNTNEVAKVIELLIESGYLCRPKEKTHRGGGRPSTRLLVNPLIP